MTFFSKLRVSRAPAVTALLAACVAGCSTLPSSGPTGGDILRASREAQQQQAALPFQLVSLASPSELPAVEARPVPALAPAVVQPTNLIGPNDLLGITIFEAGVSLFGRPSVSATRAARTTSSGSTVNVEALPAMRVDDAGYIHVPFVGRVRAAGRTTFQLQEAIRRGLIGKSQAPQVTVTIEESITNSLVLAGEVVRPGRVVLPTTRETLSDTIALAGGYRGEAKDLLARLERGGQQYEIRLSDLQDGPGAEIPVGPGDRITLMSRPQSFSVLGASNRSEQIRFPRGRISLAEAVALAGGANPNAGDAAAVFVFRYVPGPEGRPVPIVYHVNMMRPNALFLAQRFAMRDQDLLYIGNAAANQPTKMVQLISQLFIPVTTLRSTVIQ